MKNLYKNEVLARKDEELVKRYNKTIAINRWCWVGGSALALIITILLAVLGKTVLTWEAKIYAFAVAIPAIITGLSITMTILIWLGNEIGIKIYNGQKITFYSGPWTNALYLDDKLVYQGSSEVKMFVELADKSICKIILKTLTFSINILPPGSDPVTGAPKENKAITAGTPTDINQQTDVPASTPTETEKVVETNPTEPVKLTPSEVKPAIVEQKEEVNTEQPKTQE